MSRILVINDTRDQPNWGSQACAQGLVDILQATIPGVDVETYPAAWNFQQYRRDRRPGSAVYAASNVRRREFRRTEPYDPAPHTVDEFEFMANEWLEGHSGPGADRYVRDLARVDAVVFNAEGSTYRVNRAAVLALFMLWLARTKFGVPAFFLNGTVALSDIDRILPGMARKAFPVLDGVTVREPMSKRNLEAYVPGITAELVPDSVYFYGPDAFAEPSAAVQQFQADLGGSPYFVLSSSMLPIDWPRSREKSSIVALVNELRALGLQAVLTGKDAGDQWMREVAAATGARYFGPEYTYADLAALLAGAEVLVSGKYHNIIFASIMGCPAVALTTASTKIDGLCELLGDTAGPPLDVTDLRNATPEIVRRARDHIEHRASRRDELLALTKEHRAATRRMGEIVRDVLATAPVAAAERSR